MKRYAIVGVLTALLGGSSAGASDTISGALACARIEADASGSTEGNLRVTCRHTPVPNTDSYIYVFRVEKYPEGMALEAVVLTVVKAMTYDQYVAEPTLSFAFVEGNDLLVFPAEDARGCYRRYNEEMQALITCLSGIAGKTKF